MIISIFANYKRIFKGTIVEFAKEKSLLFKHSMNIVDGTNKFSVIVYVISLERYADLRFLVGH